MKLDNYQHLILQGRQFNQSKLLFDFEFVKIHFKCVLFIESNTLLFSIVDKNIGCLISLTNDGEFNGKLPYEFYYAIREQIILITQKDNISQLWFEFDKKILELEIADIREVSDEQVIDFISKTKTSDKKYDNEGEKPYFETWRRNKKRQVSPVNLFKTEKYFGIEIKKVCKKNNVSSIWHENPTHKTLDFLNKEKVLTELNS